MAAVRHWKFTVHALSRAASRFRIILGRELEAEISKTLNSSQATLVTKNHGDHLYEIPMCGIKVIAVCNLEEHVVITFLEPDRWYRTHIGRRRKHVRAEDPEDDWKKFDKDYDGTLA